MGDRGGEAETADEVRAIAVRSIAPLKAFFLNLRASFISSSVRVLFSGCLGGETDLVELLLSIKAAEAGEDSASLCS